MSSQMTAAPRQSLNARQAQTVERLFAAAQQVLDEVGHEELTIRMVAARAGVSPATAYTYFASKDHLFAEMFWRLIEADPSPKLTGRTPTARLQETTRHLARLVEGSPALAAAANKSLLGSDPEVQRLRLMIGSAWVQRFRQAIGEEADADLLSTLAFAFSGAMLQAGVGIITYEALADRLDSAVAVIMRGNS